MRIVWNKSSWYATCGAILFSLTVLPLMAHKITTEYVDTLTILDIANQDIERAIFNEGLREKRFATLRERSGLPLDASGIFGVAKITPVCDGVDMVHRCAGDPYQGKFVVQAITADGRYPFSTDTHGNFAVPLPEGEYLLSISADSVNYIMAPVAIIVASKQKRLINLTLDKEF